MSREGEPPQAQQRSSYRAALFLALAALLVLLQSFGPEAIRWLRLEPSALSSGEWWRLITGNLVHLGWAHLGWNLAALALLWIFCGPDLSTTAWALALIATLVGTGLGLAVGAPELGWYVGFSGALHGLFVIGAAARLGKRHWDGVLVLAVIVAKILYEQIQGPMPGVARTVGGPVVVDAHLYGALSGALWIVALRITQRLASRPSRRKPSAYNRRP